MSLFNEPNSENKVRISLSLLAANTLHDDAYAFDAPVVGLINRIIRDYAPDAACSISVRIEKYRDDLRLILGSADSYENVLDKLLKGEESRLVASIPEYTGQKISMLFRLNNDNLNMLTHDHVTYEEKYFRKGIRFYIQALVEEFCRLPFLKREQIYCHENLDILVRAKESQKAVSITHTNGGRYLIKVFDIMPDPLYMFNYVICKTIDTNDRKHPGKLFTFRLTRISTAAIRTSISGKYTAEEKKEIQSKINTNGVQFVGDDIIPIRVRLDDVGIRKYRNQLHLRPLYTKIEKDGHIYDFNCTLGQAEFYFLRFAEHAKILSPKSLARSFSRSYDAAAALYQGR